MILKVIILLVAIIGNSITTIEIASYNVKITKII